MTSNDPSRHHEPKTSTSSEVEYRQRLATHFESSVGTTVEKLQNFTKYVPRQTLANFIIKYEVFKKILHVQGSIVECGVYLGGGGLMTFAQLSAIFEPVNHQRKIIGFDTFSGIPDLSEEDRLAKSAHAHKGGRAVSRDVYADIMKCIELYDANRFVGHVPKVFVVRGDLRETLPRYLEEHPQTMASLLFLDLEVYEPTKLAIELLAPRIVKGGVIMFAELNDADWPGVTIAVQKTLGLNNLRVQRFPYGAYVSYAVIE